MSELTTTPNGHGEAVLPRRQPRGLLPGSWIGHSVKVEYAGADGLAAKTTGALSELFPFGPVLRASTGERFALNWDKVSLIELVED